MPALRRFWLKSHKKEGIGIATRLFDNRSVYVDSLSEEIGVSLIRSGPKYWYRRYPPYNCIFPLVRKREL